MFVDQGRREKPVQDNQTAREDFMFFLMLTPEDNAWFINYLGKFVNGISRGAIRLLGWPASAERGNLPHRRPAVDGYL
jgi:hypothetical protein